MNCADRLSAGARRTKGRRGLPAERGPPSPSGRRERGPAAGDRAIGRRAVRLGDEIGRARGAGPSGGEAFGAKRRTPMPHARTDDGVALYYEETGSGEPILFIHEFAGDYRAWEPQVRHFGRAYRCIAYNARGYPPSDVPDSPESYSQDRARLDAIAILDHLGIDRAHVVGLSMGGFAALHFGLHHQDRALSLVVAGCGYGAERDRREQFRAETENIVRFIESASVAAFADRYAGGSDSGPVPEQGSARVGGVPRPARGSFAPRRREHDARHPGTAPVHLRPRGRDARDSGPDPRPDRGRGRPLPHPQRVHEADDPGPPRSSPCRIPDTPSTSKSRSCSTRRSSGF